jgi:hypothetical protein
MPFAPPFSPSKMDDMVKEEHRLTISIRFWLENKITIEL